PCRSADASPLRRSPDLLPSPLRSGLASALRQSLQPWPVVAVALFAAALGLAWWQHGRRNSATSPQMVRIVPRRLSPPPHRPLWPPERGDPDTRIAQGSPSPHGTRGQTGPYTPPPGTRENALIGPKPGSQTLVVAPKLTTAPSGGPEGLR